MQYRIKTLGCKANWSDSQVLEAELRSRGWMPAHTELADLCIVNSCTVTDEADRQSRRLASRLARENPGAQIVMTGCSAEVDPERMKNSPGIHYVVGNQDKHRLIDLVLEARARALSAPESAAIATGSESFAAASGGSFILGSVQNYDEMRSRHPIDREWSMPEETFRLPVSEKKGETSRTRSFLKIQEGCNSFCTYCVIPYGRGPSRSLSIEQVIAQVKQLIDLGAREVILTGTNIGDYGTDLHDEATPLFDELCERILGETSLQRLRVSSLDPVEITPRLLTLASTNPRFCPHFHVSLQSPVNKILKLMKRKYNEAQVEQCLWNIAKIPGGAFVGMDVITGFPGESDADFEAGVEKLRSLPWSRLHVFPYSERSGTPATRLKEVVQPAVRKRRAEVLKRLSDERMQQRLAQALGQPVLESVLLEAPGVGPDGEEGWISGYTPDYTRVFIRQASLPAGVGQNSRVTVIPEAQVFDSASGDGGIVAAISQAL